MESEGNVLSAMAWVAGTLRRVHQVAASVALAASNARVVAARAGNDAMGFVPITRSVDTLARDVDQGVARVEKTAIRSAQCAAAAFIVGQRAARFEAARQKLAVRSGGVADAHQRFEKAASARRQELRIASGTLVRELDRIDALLRSSLTLSTLARIEASRANGYRVELAQVGDTIDRAAETIRSATTECRQRLAAIGI